MVEIEYWHTSQGENPIYDFINTLPQAAKAKVFRMFSTIEMYGLSSVIPHIKKLTGLSLWEIRIVGKNNVRILYVVRNKNQIYILHAFIKKTQKTSERDINIALKRIPQFDK